MPSQAKNVLTTLPKEQDGDHSTPEVTEQVNWVDSSPKRHYTLTALFIDPFSDQVMLICDIAIEHNHTDYATIAKLSTQALFDLDCGPKVILAHTPARCF
jgi:hypothetical protein